jgi:L-sorbose 1-phosphate reductase
MQLLEELPQEILSWQLKGTGLDNFGAKGRPDTVPFPSYTEENLIARIDAVGLCYSDIKLISAGATHPRIEGRNLAAQPTVPGHEVAITIVGVGDTWKDKFKLGSRYIIQADIYYKGKGVAFGYAIPGGLSQYVVIGKEIIEGDEGCYLLPVKNETGRAEAALVEPWTCVIAAYQIRARLGVRENGRLQLAGFPRGQVPLNLGGIGKLAQVIHSGLTPENVKAVEELARRSGAALVGPGQPPDSTEGPTDIVCAGTPDRDSFSKLAASLQTDGAIGIHSSEAEVDFPVDVGKVHYRRMELLGSTDGRVSDSYRANNREMLVAGGRAWFVGGAGPMGQMHVIKAVMD